MSVSVSRVLGFSLQFGFASHSRCWKLRPRHSMVGPSLMFDATLKLVLSSTFGSFKLRSTSCLLPHNLVSSNFFHFTNFTLTNCWSLLQRALWLTFFAVGQSVLQIEGAVGEDLVAVGARKALRVEVCRHRLQAVLRKEKILDKHFR